MFKFYVTNRTLLYFLQTKNLLLGKSDVMAYRKGGQPEKLAVPGSSSINTEFNFQSDYREVASLNSSELHTNYPM